MTILVVVDGNRDELKAVDVDDDDDGSLDIMLADGVAEFNMIPCDDSE